MTEKQLLKQKEKEEKARLKLEAETERTRAMLQYEDKYGFVITFQMPDHDVTLEMQSRNSMMYNPDAQG